MLGAICLALAGLVKVPAILILGPIIWLGWLARRWRLFYDAEFVIGLIVALGAITAWYLHADRIYLQTGLTQAIFRPSSRYIGEIAAYSGFFTTVSHWTTWGDPENRARILDIVGRFLHLHLTPLGAVGVALGFLRLKTPRRTVLDIWVLAAASLVAVSVVGQYFHEFHQLPFHPPLALFFGLGMQPLFAWERWPLALQRPRIAGTLAATMFVVLSGAAIWCFVESSVFLLYRPDNLNIPLIHAGRAIDEATPSGSLLVVVEYRPRRKQLAHAALLRAPPWMELRCVGDSSDGGGLLAGPEGRLLFRDQRLAVDRGVGARDSATSEDRVQGDSAPRNPP